MTAHDSPVSAVLARLEAVKRAGSGWIARCPAHDDGRPSLKIDTGDDGRALLHCYAGCDAAAIVAAIGLTMADTFARDSPPVRPPASYATSERIAYDYHDAAGAVVFQEVRDPPKQFWLRRPDERGGWIKGMDGVEPVLWNLPELIARPGETVFLPEGCKDAARLRSLGLLATTTANGASAPWLDSYSETLRGRDVAILADNDPAGMLCAHRRAQALQGVARRVRIVLLPDLPAKGDVSDWLDARHTKEELDQLLKATPEWTPDDGSPEPESWPAWEPPIPLDDHAGPDFPLDALPGVLGTFTDAVATSTQTPPGLAAVMALGAISAATRGRYAVSIPEHDWTEPVVIQAVAFALPGERKSAVVNEITTALSLWEREQRLEDERVIQEWASRRRVLQKQLDTAESEASKLHKGQVPAGDPDLIRREAARALAEHDTAIRYPTRVIVDDVTPEKARQMIVEQGGALAVISAEGTFFAILAGRYSESPSLEVMLNGHAGEPITIDRKSGPALFTPRGSLTIAVACQPHVAETMGSVDGFTARGGTARILPAFLASAVGARSIEARPIPADLRREWETTIRAILDHDPPRPADSAGHPLPCRLLLDAEAYAAFQRYRAGHEPQLRRGGELGEIADWGSKLPGAILRIAGLLHIGTHERPEDQRIAARTVERAIAAGGYFAAHATVMYRVMAGRSGQSTARQVLEVIRGLESPTTKREIHRTVQNRTAFQKVDDLTAPLALLEEYGWIRTERDGKSLIVHLSTYGQSDNGDNGAAIRGNDPPLSPLSLLPGETKQNPPPVDTTDTTRIRGPEPEVLGVLSMLPGDRDAMSLDGLDPLDRVDVEEIATGLRQGGPEAIEAWRTDVETNRDLTDHDRSLALLALRIARFKPDLIVHVEAQRREIA